MNVSWICTRGGRKVDPFDESTWENISIDDIAHALSMMCRFTGHTERFYSVAEHSLAVSYLLASHSREVQLQGLLHDAAEAYLVDVARPVKHHPAMEEYRKAERNLQSAIFRKYSLRPTAGSLRAIEKADQMMFLIEANKAMGWPSVFEQAGCDISEVSAFPFELSFMEPKKAEMMFLDRFWKLKGRV